MTDLLVALQSHGKAIHTGDVSGTRRAQLSAGSLTRFLDNLIISLNFFVLPLAATFVAPWLVTRQWKKPGRGKRKKKRS